MIGLNRANSFRDISLSDTVLNSRLAVAGRAFGLPCDDISKFSDISRGVLFTSICSSRLEPVSCFNSGCVSKDVASTSVAELVDRVPDSVCIRF